MLHTLINTLFEIVLVNFSSMINSAASTTVLGLIGMNYTALSCEDIYNNNPGIIMQVVKY